MGATSTDMSRRPTIGSTARACHVILRPFELACSVIVLGLLSRAIYLINQADIGQDSRILYAEVLAVISTLFSLLFVLPFLYAYLVAPVDVILFIMWMVAFGLLAARTGTNVCNSWWYWNYWGWAWGRWYIDGVPNPAWSFYNAPGCASYRVVLAFSFMVSIAYLLSAILGAIITSRYWKKDRPVSTHRTATRNISAPMATNPPVMAQSGGPHRPAETSVGTAVDVERA
ncbi:hypothetical protein QBC38DRAFT_464843 [Podospora fimiseda]|uniref:MARVEL domain-containing protein n=1 Tax=Podospora fimiseda TaxID=252190 RepID=A0AAN7BYS8_9PEZI|nr:hypothetical protein QBC38DRAFT_464843 [Podospora fimiseda]